MYLSLKWGEMVRGVPSIGSPPQMLQQSPELGTQPGLPMWVAEANNLSLHRLPPKAHVSRSLPSGERLRPEPKQGLHHRPSASRDSCF